jgi:nicotinate-nucleotide adenylyltransferase
VNAPALLGAREVALYGGTFDPVHAGHLAVARAALAHARLDGVVFVPAHRSPHRLDHAPLADDLRVELLRAALAGEPRFDLWTIEVERQGLSFTIDTVRAARALRGADAPAPFLVIGSDSLAGLDRWRDVAALLELVRPIVVPRVARALVDEELARLAQVLPASAHAALVAGLVPLEAPHPASATALRAALARGTTVADWLPPAVLAIVEQRGLYGFRARQEGAP